MLYEVQWCTFRVVTLTSVSSSKTAHTLEKPIVYAPLSVCLCLFSHYSTVVTGVVVNTTARVCVST